MLAAYTNLTDDNGFISSVNENHIVRLIIERSEVERDMNGLGPLSLLARV